MIIYLCALMSSSFISVAKQVSSLELRAHPHGSLSLLNLLSCDFEFMVLEVSLLIQFLLISDVKNRPNFVIFKDKTRFEDSLIKIYKPINKFTRSERSWLSQDFTNITSMRGRHFYFCARMQNLLMVLFFR